MRKDFSPMVIIFIALAVLAPLGVAQNVSINLTPQGVPIQIPAYGGSFNYIIAATNNGTSPQQAAVWCMITMPSGSPYGPVLGPVIVTLGAGQTLERTRTQIVPATAPAGAYAFNAYIGVYPNTIWDSDSFPFWKASALPGGTQLWEARYNGPVNEDDIARAIAVDASGNVYVTGGSDMMAGSAYGDFDYVTIKYNPAGVQLWVAGYDGGSSTNNTSDFAADIAVDASGNVYVTGFSSDGWYDEYATIKYSSTGGESWVARYSGLYYQSSEATSIAVDGSGNVYVTGYEFSGSFSYDYATVKYNSEGVELWARNYNGPGNYSDEANSIAVDGSGNVYVTGYTSGWSTPYDYATVKYNSEGEEQWVAFYDGPANGMDWAESIAVDGGGNAYVTGASMEAPYVCDYATVKYSPAGLELWVARFNGLAADDDRASSIVVDGSGNAYVTGSSTGSGTLLDYATIKYNSAGLQQWVARYDGLGHDDDMANSIAVAGNGNVYVTGYSDAQVGSGINNDYATIRYDANGNQIWVARYNGPGNGNDAAYGLVVDGSGNVCVTGGSTGSGTGPDYATIKYAGGNLDNWMPVEATIFGQPLPQECRLEQNYPNPFNARTVLSYQLPVASQVQLAVYDPLGRLIEMLVDGWRQAGTHELTFDGSALPSGIYFAKLKAGDYSQVQKMILMK